MKLLNSLVCKRSTENVKIRRKNLTEINRQYNRGNHNRNKGDYLDRLTSSHSRENMKLSVFILAFTAPALRFEAQNFK